MLICDYSPVKRIGKQEQPELLLYPEHLSLTLNLLHALQLLGSFVLAKT